MQSITEIVADVLQRGLDDWIRLGEVAWVVRYRTGLKDSKEIKEKTKEVIEEILKKEYAAAGDVILTDDGNQSEFRPWPPSIGQTIDTIDNLWDQFGELEASFMCWLSNTQKGDDFVKGQKISYPPNI